MANNNNKNGVHFYNGNTKIGNMLTFNKLAGNNVINGCMGSCGKYCTGCWNHDNWKKSDCYVAKSYYQYKDNCINSHIVNTKAMRENCEAAFEALNGQLKRARTLKTVRIHASGELESVEELQGWFSLAAKHPNRKFYVYTKAYDIVDKVLLLMKAKNQQLPANLFINISIWHEHGIDFYNKWKHLQTIRAYAFDDETFDYEAHGLKINGKCPAYRKNEKGKVKLSHELTCDKCGLCFQEKVKALTCLSH